MIVLILISFFISAGLTWVVRRIALARKIVDTPSGGRKIHREPIPLLGGVSIMLTFFFVCAVVNARFTIVSKISTTELIGVCVASFIMLLGGVWDDVKDLSAKKQFVIIVIALLTTVLAGVGPNKVTNPFGGTIALSSALSSALVYVWLLLITHTTKLLDGLDGLVTGITAIGATIIGLFSLLTNYYQPDIAAIAFILAGSCAGFLVWNFHPAKIFLGNVGSVWTGYMLGVLAVVAGGKIAITLLVLGAPLVDMVLVVGRRIASGKPPWQGDASHLHFQLLKTGLGHRGTVYVYWATAAVFGGLTIILQSSGKLIALSILAVLTLLMVAVARPTSSTVDK